MRSKGFTLIELLVVVAIIGILAAVGVVAYNGYTSSAKKNATKANFSMTVSYVKSEVMKCELDSTNKILEGSVNQIKEDFSEKIWEITFKGNTVSFANSVWGGWELLGQKQMNESTIKATIKLTDKLLLNDFIRGILDNVEIIELNKVVPTMNDIFINVVNQSEKNKSNENE